MNILLENVSKKFENEYVLEGINLKIDSNQVYCLLGENGAGKSTLINIACNLMDPDEGNVFINGKTYHTDGISIKQAIGLQHQYDTLIEELNTFEYLYFIGKIYHMTKADISRQINLLTEYFFSNMSELNKTINTYSRGMKKKVSLCAALLHKPAIVFFDEPFANIDPATANALCNVIQAYKNERRCIVIASHDLLYVNKIATHIGIIDNHRIVFNDTIDKIRSSDGLDGNLLRYMGIKEKRKDLLTKITK
jgi:ABC-2 type transport system ATP-binding protein